MPPVFFWRFSWLVILFLGVAYVLWRPPLAWATPDPDANPAWSGWFNGLSQPHTGMSCCSQADCRRTASRIRAGHYEAILNGRWVVIPPEKVLAHTDNPTGEAVLCWSPATGVLCFVRGPEG